jgi:cystathionine gamma-synthase
MIYIRDIFQWFIKLSLFRVVTKYSFSTNINIYSRQLLMAKKREQYYHNSVANPIYQTATYYFENTDQIIDYHLGKSKVGRYARYDNPSWLEVEEKLASLDKCEEALVFSSGMSAIAATLFTFLNAGENFLLTGKGYRNIRNFSFDLLGRFGVEVVTLPLASNDNFYDELAFLYKENTKVIFVESPSNPHLFLIDLQKLTKLIDEKTILIVDSTFATPINFQPKLFGADLVIHSCGKYIGGHADIMAGSVAGSRQLISEIRKTRNVIGNIIDPNAAFLLNRSLSTLEIRMNHLNEKGLILAKFLEGHPKVNQVFYTGLASHPQYDLAEKYLFGHGGVVTFELKGKKEEVSNFVDNIKLPYMGTNFGSSYSMIEQLSIFTYFNQTEQERKDLGITDNLVRYSIGLDDSIDEIIRDIEISLSCM